MCNDCFFSSFSYLGRSEVQNIWQLCNANHVKVGTRSHLNVNHKGLKDYSKVLVNTFFFSNITKGEKEIKFDFQGTNTLESFNKHCKLRIYIFKNHKAQKNYVICI